VVFSVVYSFVFMMAFVIVNPAPSQLSTLLVLAGSMTVSALMVFVLPRLTAKKKQRQAAEKLDELTAATRGYIENLEQRRVFAPVTVESRSKHPHVFVVENPGLWCFLVNWVADNRFTDPKLPDGMHLCVTGESPNFQVNVTGRGILGTLKHRNTIIRFD
jgi:hypothetical protein